MHRRAGRALVASGIRGGHGDGVITFNQISERAAVERQAPGTIAVDLSSKVDVADLHVDRSRITGATGQGLPQVGFGQVEEPVTERCVNGWHWRGKIASEVQGAAVGVARGIGRRDGQHVWPIQQGAQGGRRQR
ncbi:hypothetical protein D3C79_574220 [compost metagenome]